MQALLFGFLFSEKMRAKYVFILNGILFFYTLWIVLFLKHYCLHLLNRIFMMDLD